MIFFTADGCSLFAHAHAPAVPHLSTVYVVAGVTGINHEKEGDLIDVLASGENRVVVMHPRGTGLSQGKRGDPGDFGRLVDDLVEFTRWDRAQEREGSGFFLYGHSMSTALLLAAAERLDGVTGAILVNPPFLRKRARGMSPTAWQLVKYAWYYLFARHRPIVNIAGDPSQIENEMDRQEASERQHDPMLVNVLSLGLMLEVNTALRHMPDRCRRANYPLLLLYGAQDPIVERAGCQRIFDQWGHPDKEFRTIEHGGHGRSTVLGARNIVQQWMRAHPVTGPRSGSTTSSHREGAR